MNVCVMHVCVGATPYEPGGRNPPEGGQVARARSCPLGESCERSEQGQVLKLA